MTLSRNSLVDFSTALGRFGKGPPTTEVAIPSEKGGMATTVSAGGADQ
jgi:hypothetical protein